MKTNKAKHGNKSGGILVLVAIVMLTISIMVIGLMKLQERSGVESVYERQTEQAFWLAEAGIQLTIDRLNWQAAYRNNPETYTTNIGNGSIAVTVANSGSGDYTIESVGRVGSFNRVIEQKVSTVPGAKVNATSLGGPSSLNARATADIGLMVYDGDIYTGNNPSTVQLNALIADDDVSVSGRGDYDFQSMPAGTTEPTLDSSSYVSAFTAVRSRGTATDSVTDSNGSLSGVVDYTTNSVSFSGRPSISSETTISSYGDITFERGTTFNGPVTILAGGQVHLNGSTVLPSGSTVIAGSGVNVDGGSTIQGGSHITAGGNVAFGNQMTFEGGTVVYSHNDLSVAAGGSSEVTGTGIAFLANGDIILSSNFNDFRGVMFANGTIEFNANMDIWGTVVAGDGLEINSNLDFHEDLEAYNWALAGTGIGINFNDVILTKLAWTELPPL